jgi:hypothetical protein
VCTASPTITIVAVLFVAVPPEHELFQDEEREDAGEQRAERGRWRQLFECLRHQAEQRRAEQRAHRVGNEPGDDAFADGAARGEEKPGRQQAADAAGD